MHLLKGVNQYQEVFLACYSHNISSYMVVTATPDHGFARVLATRPQYLQPSTTPPPHPKKKRREKAYQLSVGQPPMAHLPRKSRPIGYAPLYQGTEYTVYVWGSETKPLGRGYAPINDGILSYGTKLNLSIR